MELKATYLAGIEKGVPTYLSQRTYIGARVESRCRSEEAVEQGLEARIADPLWMLARQWQMGEFQGEDNGSPIRVQIQYRTEHADRVLLQTGDTSDFIDVRTPVPFDAQGGSSSRPPLETVIEREPMVHDWRVRVQMGQQFERLLRRVFGEGELTKANQIVCIYRKPEHFGVKIPEDLVDVDYATQRYLRLMEGRAIDGSAALEAYNQGALPALPAGLVVDQVKINQAFVDLQSWFGRLFSTPQSDQEAYWNSQQLEYEFTLRKESVVTGGNGSDYNIQLSAPDYRNGDLDWYACDLLSRLKSPPEVIEIACPALPPGLHRIEHIYVRPNSFVDHPEPLVRIVKLKPPVGEPVIVRARARQFGNVHEIHVQQGNLIMEGMPLLSLRKSSPRAVRTARANPTRIGFAGKPNERWWALEDYRVDLARLNPNTSELAKLMFAEFALVHADDWYLVPLELPLGSLTSIISLKVESVFGDLITIGPALETGATGRDRWELFTLASATQPGRAGVQYLFIPPSLGDREESPPIEEVRFIRDDGANMVFAIEHTVANGLGNPVQGYEAQVERRERKRKTDIEGLEKIERSIMVRLQDAALSEDERAALTEDAEEVRHLLAQQRQQGSISSAEGMPRYRLASVVPDNWIPFVPRRVPQDHAGLRNVTDASIRLRQAVMMRSDVANHCSEITPMTRVLHDPRELKQSTIWLNEESVPRAGVKVQLTHQRVRWTDGKTYVWLGRKVKKGRGEGSSGLKFDSAGRATVSKAF